MKPLNIRDIAIIDAFPVYKFEKIVLNVGCGEARIDYQLANAGYRVYATDVRKSETWRETNNLTFHQSDIFNLVSFPVKEAPVVLCIDVLEHLKDYKTALSNLLKLATVKLIITTPYQHSFDAPSHLNYWSDEAISEFKDVKEFAEFCKPYSIAISKIITKPKDAKKHQYAYLIVVDKRNWLQ